MKINNSSSLTTQISKIKNNPSDSQEIVIFNTQEDSSVSLSNTTRGANADVTIDNTPQKTLMLGFQKQSIQVKSIQGQTFEINLYIKGSADKEKVKQLTNKISKALSNLPENILSDIQKECKHIFIIDGIPNKTSIKGDPKALAIAPLNQIFLSAKTMSDLSDKEIADVLTHELGHLVDQTNTSGIGRCSQWHKNAYLNIRKTLIEDLGFTENFHSLDSAAELFADYYLYKCGEPSNNHRCRKLFDTIEAYKTDKANLTPEEFSAKYSDKTGKIDFLLSEWSKLEKNYSDFLENLNTGHFSRGDLSVDAMSYEQIIEHNERVTKTRKNPS